MLVGTQPTNPCTNTPHYQAHNIIKAHVSFLARGILYLAHEQKVLVQSAQCSCVRTRASKTQGVVDVRLEDKPELQLPHSSVMIERCFLILGCQQEFKFPMVLVSPHLLEDITTTLLEEDGIFGSYTNARQLEQVGGIRVVPFVTVDRNQSHAFWAWHVFHPLFSTCLY